ncbi:MAG TPA: class I SAM-dependent methyltransferase, partial [bacterium]|nr:class I SAM-dependent methyltransferase [bacterium]
LSSPADVLILGAGMDPLGLELHHAFPRILSKIYEIDQSGMRQKKKLYEKTGAGWKKKIRLVESGVSAEAMRKILPESVQVSETPLLVIAEGLTYYLAGKTLRDLFSLFPAGRKNVTWFLEYLVPYKKIRPARRFIPKRIFHFIRRFAGLPSISRYTREDLARMLRPAGYLVSRHKTLHDMERERTRTARYFKKASDGWVECLVARRVSEDEVKRRESFRL